VTAVSQEKQNSGRKWLARLSRSLVVVLAIYLLFSLAAGIYLAEFSLHLGKHPLQHRKKFEAIVEQQFHGTLTDVSVVAKDGSTLKGWLVQPGTGNGDAVVLLHGIGDNREGMAGYAQLMLTNGYSVLLPDARENGESGGAIATYGLLEARDLHQWVSWLEEREHPHCVYGLGESYGAALLLQGLAVEHRFCAVIAESSFSRFAWVAPERAAYYAQMPSSRTMKWFLVPAVHIAMAYVRVFYHLDFSKANPADAVHRSKTPVLLIHGTEDIDIQPWHSSYIAMHNPDHVQLWMVPNVNHCGTWQARHREFVSRVLNWFQTHTSQPSDNLRASKETKASS